MSIQEIERYGTVHLQASPGVAQSSAEDNDSHKGIVSPQEATRAGGQLLEPVHAEGPPFRCQKQYFQSQNGDWQDQNKRNAEADY